MIDGELAADDKRICFCGFPLRDHKGPVCESTADDVTNCNKLAELNDEIGEPWGNTVCTKCQHFAYDHGMTNGNCEKSNVYVTNNDLMNTWYMI